MATYVQIREFRDAIRIRAGERANSRERLFGAIIGAAVSAMASARVLGWWWPVVSAIGGVTVFAAFPDKSFQLVATRFEFTAKGDFGRRSPKEIVVCAADICGLEFRPGLAPRGDGLYVVTNKQAYCLLPYLDSRQTGEAIDAIKTKFPGLAETWQVKLGTSDRFLTLGLRKSE